MSFSGKSICVLLTISLFFSCNKKENIEEKYTYEIISLLYNQLTSPIDYSKSMPPTPNGMAMKKEDSIHLLNYSKELIAKKQIIAIIPELEIPRNRKRKAHHDCSEYESLLNEYYIIDQKDSLKISKIHNIRKDSIIHFNESMIDKNRKDFENFDILLSFSQIEFNKEYDKAIIATSMSTSRLAGGGSLVFLERKNGLWTVKCTKNLWIS
ncbi:hypothetical protein [Urechidicola croceus]|uniref:Lipoprotein n=1 Tax=Urechidicola croceus TaxID=1850246 RepID=A0A1D8P7H9_9FLAO|nr:hypothetical protein [Urechidicola croceus]AOW20535.1 hypothetical protein LPB138_07525 [Urechidicola croceus]